MPYGIDLTCLRSAKHTSIETTGGDGYDRAISGVSICHSGRRPHKKMQMGGESWMAERQLILFVSKGDSSDDRQIGIGARRGCWLVWIEKL